MSEVRSARKVGRPREFDIDEALDAAMRLFWHKGYEGTSLSDLTEATGVNRPCLYAAFGNKEELFRKALDRYAELRDPATRAALARPTARGVAEALLFSSAEALAQPESPGCLLVQGALACGDGVESIRHELCARRGAAVQPLRLRFERAKAEGDLPPEAEPADLARYVVTVINGMAVQAASGAGAEELRRVAEIALRAWPKETA